MREPVLEGLPPSRLQLRREEKDRDRRVRRMLLILLLLLLLLFALALAFILIYGPSILETLRPGTVQSLFSIYGFDRPLSVSTDAQNNIYVSDTGHSKFYVFDSSGNYVRRIGTSQKHQRFYGVFGSRVDAGEKNIYVAGRSMSLPPAASLSGVFPKTGLTSRSTVLWASPPSPWICIKTRFISPAPTGFMSFPRKAGC